MEINLLPRESGIITNSIKDVDTRKRYVKGVLSRTEMVNSHNQIFYRNSFDKTIRERGKKGTDEILTLFNHDAGYYWLPIGKPSELYMDGVDLVHGTEFLDTPQNNDILTLIENGVLNQHSIGFQLVKDKYRYEEQTDILHIFEAKLWEGSIVLWGANSKTPVLSINAANEILEVCTNALKIGTLRDETYMFFQNSLNIAKMQINQNTAHAPEQPDTTTVPNQQPNYDLYLNAIKNLKF